MADPADEAVTDRDLAMALCRVLEESEAHLGICQGRPDAFGARIDRVLRLALKGGLDSRAYAALHLVRSANKDAP